jgi:hypothetical protein
MKKAVILGMSALLLPSLLLTGCARLPKAGTALTDKERKEAQSNCIGQYTALGIVGGSLLGILVSNKEDRVKGASHRRAPPAARWPTASPGASA